MKVLVVLSAFERYVIGEVPAPLCKQVHMTVASVFAAVSSTVGNWWYALQSDPRVRLCAPLRNHDCLPVHIVSHLAT